MRVLGGEDEMSAVEPACIASASALPSFSQNSKERRTAVVFAIVRDDQHDLPFEHTVPNQTAADAGDVLVAVHELQLTAQEPGRRRTRHDGGSLGKWTVL